MSRENLIGWLDLLALVFGQVALICGGLAVFAIIVMIPMNFAWRRFRNAARFLDMMQIYVRHGRKEAKKFLEKHPSALPPSPGKGEP